MKHGLRCDRLSACGFCANAFRLLVHALAYAVVVLATGTYSAPAGGLALAVLMLPIVVLTAEEAIKAVPRITRDAAYGMGCTPTQVAWKSPQDEGRKSRCSPPTIMMKRSNHMPAFTHMQTK